MASSRVQRARETEAIAAKHFRENGAVDAERVPASIPGRDIRKVPCVAPEVKARRDFDPKTALKQAARNAGDDLPIVILRLNGMGPETVGQWPVLLTFDNFIKIAREAGYW